CGKLRGPNFLGIMLDPARLGINLAELLLGGSDYGARLIEENGAGTGRALVQGEYAFHELAFGANALQRERTPKGAGRLIAAAEDFGQCRSRRKGPLSTSKPRSLNRETSRANLFQFALPGHWQGAYTAPHFAPPMNPFLRRLAALASLTASTV